MVYRLASTLKARSARANSTVGDPGVGCVKERVTNELSIRWVMVTPVSTITQRHKDTKTQRDGELQENHLNFGEALMKDGIARILNANIE